MIKTINDIALIIILIGGMNWGMIGLFQIDLIKMLFGSQTFVTRTVYSFVGISAFYLIVAHVKSNTASLMQKTKL